MKFSLRIILSILTLFICNLEAIEKKGEKTSPKMQIRISEDNLKSAELKPIVKIFESDTKLIDACALKVAEMLKKMERLGRAPVLGLSTSPSLFPFYKKLNSVLKEEQVNLSRLIIFTVDEFTGIAQDNPQSKYYGLFANLFEGLLWTPSNPFGIRVKNINTPNGKARNWQSLSSQEHMYLLKYYPKHKRGMPLNEEEEILILEKRANDYENLLKKLGPISLQILAVEANGEIGFLQSGSSFTEGTQVIKLADKFRKQYIKFFNNELDSVPRYVISLGLQNLLQSKIIFLLASGKDKMQTVKDSLTSPISNEFPASAFRNHPQVVYFLDKAASKSLKETEITTK